MAETEDRTVKVTFEADKRGLSESLKSLNEQAEKLKSTLDKLGEVSSKNSGGRNKVDSKLSAHGVDPKSLSAVKELVKLEEKLLSIVEDRNKALRIQADLYKKAAAAGGNGPGKGGGSSAGLAAMFGKGGPVLASLAKVAGVITGAVSAATASQMRLGYGAYADYAGSLAGLAGTGTSRASMKGRAAAGVQYGYSPQETAEQARTVAIQTGNAMNVTQAQMLTRATTMDMSQVSGFMGTMTKAGGMQGNRDIKKIIALGFRSGIDQSRLPEYMQGVEKVVQQQGGMQGGDVNAFDYAGVLQALGAGGASGLQGSRGAAVFSKLNQAIIKPGGGEAGKALMLQSMGFGRPGGDTSYYEALKQQEKGATSGNIGRLFSETRSQYGGGQEQILALREMTGLGITVLEQVRNVSGSFTGEERKSKIEDILNKAKPVEERAADSMEEVGFHTKRIAFLQNRLVNIGSDNYASVVKFQDSINRMLDPILKVANKMLFKATSLMDVTTSHAMGEGDSPALSTLVDKVQSFSMPGYELGKELGAKFLALNGNEFDPRQHGEIFGPKEAAAVAAIMKQSPALQKSLNDALDSPGGQDDKAHFNRFRGQGDQAALVKELAYSAIQMQDGAYRIENRTNAGPAVGTIPAMLGRPGGTN